MMWITYQNSGHRSQAHLVLGTTADGIMTRCGITIYPWWDEKEADDNDFHCRACEAVNIQLTDKEE
jgi:hypothetical protein